MNNKELVEEVVQYIKDNHYDKYETVIVAGIDFIKAFYKHQLDLNFPLNLKDEKAYGEQITITGSLGAKLRIIHNPNYDNEKSYNAKLKSLYPLVICSNGQITDFYVKYNNE